MQLCKNLCINGKAPPPRKTPRPNAATDPGTPTGQQGQPLHSTPGRKGSRRPTAGRAERRHRLPGQAPKTDSQPATLTQHRRTNPNQAGQQAKQGKRPLASKPPPQLLQDFRQPLSAVANSQPERANTPPNPQQGNPTPPQTPHPYFEAVELIVSRICAKPYVFLQKAKTPPTTPKERPRIDV